MTRRLLNKTEVAKKLGFSVDWFNERQRALEATGFPARILTRDAFGGDRWDEEAIDIWLDSKMPTHLRNHTKLENNNAAYVERTLQARSRGMSL